LFSDPEVIKSSREFICVRIESYESEANQEIVRSHLGGRFENTAFCILSPDGKKRLTRSARGPKQISEDFSTIADIANSYRSKGKLIDSRVPDFNSFELALNVSSADQKILILVVAAEEKMKAIQSKLGPVAWDQNVIGKFNYDFESEMEKWPEILSLNKAREGLYIIEPGEYGLTGKVVKALTLETSPKEIMESMLFYNSKYADRTEKKNYSDHVAKGRRLGKTIEMAVPFGEDRDGDGVIDKRGGSRRR